MKSKDKKELFSRSEKELRKALKEAKVAVFNLVLDHRQNKLKNTSQISMKKKEVAFILTALKEKEIANAENA